jgi:hypothetical protein
MPDTVIARVNALATDEPEPLIFTNRRGRPIGDVEIPGAMVFGEDDDNAEMPVLDPVGIGGVELTGVDVAGKAPQTIEIDDLDIPQPDPLLIETVEEPTVPTMEHDEPTQVAQAMETTGLQRSTRVRLQPKNYEPTMTGSKYSYAVTQLETHGVVHPDSHMFVQEDFYQSDPDVVAHVMTQLSLKSGLKQWGNQAYAVVTSEMKQLHLRNTFKSQSIGANYHRLSARWCWNHTCFSRRNEMDPSREGLWLEETKSEPTFPREMQVRQLSPQKPCCYHASSMPRKKGMSL